MVHSASMTLEPPPAIEKTLQPGKWYGRIALLWALEPVVFLCYIFLCLPLLPCCASPWQEIALVLGIGCLLCPFAAIGFGIAGLKTEGRLYAWIGLVLSLLYALTVIVFLVISIPQAREEARRMQCSSHTKGILLAFHNYSDTHGALPPLYTVDEEGKPLHSWRVLILPFLEQQDLYNQIRLDEPWDSEYNKQFHDRMSCYYQCPSSPQKGCSFSVIAGGSFVPATEAGSIVGMKFEDITDGTSNTLALIKVKEPFCWMDPTADITLEELGQGKRIGSYHKYWRGRIYLHTGYLDGSVRTMLLEDVIPEFLKSAATPNGGD